MKPITRLTSFGGIVLSVALIGLGPASSQAQRATGLTNRLSPSTAAPLMPPVCPAAALVRAPDPERPTPCDYLYRNAIPRTCSKYAVFYLRGSDGGDWFEAYGVCASSQAVHFHLQGRLGASASVAANSALSDLTLASAAIGAQVAEMSLAQSGFEFGTQSGGGFFPKGPGGGPPIGGDEAHRLLNAAATAHFAGQEEAHHYLQGLPAEPLP